MTDGGHLGPADPAPAAVARRGLPLGAILGIVFGGIALVLVVAIVVGVVVVSGLAKGSAGGGTATTSATGVVRAYLTAVAAGKASEARGQLTGDAADGPLLTDAVLAASRELEPISRIRVGKPSTSGYYPDVTATYALGGRTVTAKFHLSRDEDGGFAISSGLARLPASYLKGLDITVNGAAVTVPDEGLELFPGAYTIAVTTPSLTLEGDGRVELTGPDQSLEYDALKPKLTDAGLATFRRLVAASVKSCLASRTLKAGCGLTLKSTLSDGTAIDQGSVRRTSTPQLKAKLAHLEPTPDLDTPTLMTAAVSENPDVTATGSRNGVHGSFSVLFGPHFTSASIDVSQPDPEVDWR